MVAVVALIVFGPKGLAEAAKGLGRTLRSLQPAIREVLDVTQDLKGTLDKELGIQVRVLWESLVDALPANDAAAPPQQRRGHDGQWAPCKRGWPPAGTLPAGTLTRCAQRIADPASPAPAAADCPIRPSVASAGAARLVAEPTGKPRQQAQHRSPVAAAGGDRQGCIQASVAAAGGH